MHLPNKLPEEKISRWQLIALKLMVGVFAAVVSEGFAAILTLALCVRMMPMTIWHQGLFSLVDVGLVFYVALLALRDIIQMIQETVRYIN